MQPTQIISGGAVSFNPLMHGAPAVASHSIGDQSFSFASQQSSLFNPDISEATAQKIAALQVKLNQKLGPEYISQRPGPGGGPKLTYAEGWKIINLANEVFGFNGWSSNVVSITTDFVDFNEESKRFNIGVTAIIRVTLRDGVYHEDIGYGLLENSKSKGAALDKCKKEAVTDGLKRALRNFGNLLGNCLYDKTYTQEVIKIKVQPPKFDKNELHRRPEFEDVKPQIASASTNITATTTMVSNTIQDNSIKGSATTSRLLGAAQPQVKPISSGPQRTHSDMSIQKPSSRVETRVQENQSDTSCVSISAPKAQQARQNESLECDRKPPIPKHLNAANHCNANALIASKAHSSAQPAPQPDDVEPSFHFNSDDDAFLAAVDLGEGDLGQPLLPETDMGRPIDGDDDGDDMNTFLGHVLAESTPPCEKQKAEQGPPNGILSSLLPHNRITTRQKFSVSASSSNSVTKPGPPPLGTVTRNHHYTTTAAQHMQLQSSSSKPPSKQQSSHTTKENQPPLRTNDNQPSNIQRQNQGQKQQQGVPSAASTSSTGEAGSCANRDPRGLPMGQGQWTMPRTSMKRPLEAISSVQSPRQGTVVSGYQAQQKREVLGRLEVGDGGDVKRVRR